MTTPRDDIAGLSERLRVLADEATRDAAYVCIPMRQAATQLDSLSARVKELEQDCAEAYQVVGTLSSAHVDLFNDPQVVKALDNLSAAANGNKRPHYDLLPFAPLLVSDPLITAEDRALRAEQERDEAYERAAKVADQWLESSWIDEVFAARSIAAAIRRLASGPEKEKKE